MSVSPITDTSQVSQTRRLFVAFPLDTHSHTGIAAFRSLNSSLSGQGLRWTPDANLHLTVFFLGTVATTCIESLQRTLGAVLANQPLVQLRFQRFTVEPRHRPRMIWARYHTACSFTELSDQVETACRPYMLEQPRHFPEPVPHITVARLRRPISELTQPISTLSEFTGAQAELWWSRRGEQGVAYQRLGAWPLGEQ